MTESWSALTERRAEDSLGPLVAAFAGRWAPPPSGPSRRDAALEGRSEELAEKRDRKARLVSGAAAETDGTAAALEDLERRLAGATELRGRLLEEKRLFDEGVKGRYAALRLAGARFKERLGMRHRTEDGATVVQLLATGRRKDDRNSAILRHGPDGSRELAETRPPLPITDALAHKLKATGDVPGMLAAARRCFLLNAPPD